MTLQPIGNAVVIYPQREQQHSGIIVSPEVAQGQDPVWGTIVALGPKVKNPDLKLNQTVLFEKFSGQDKRIWLGEQGEEVEIRIITEDNILAFIE